MIEAFCATLKNGMYSWYVFATKIPAQFAIAVFYNRKRMYSSIGYRTPALALTDHLSDAPAA